MFYHSTRGGGAKATASEAVVAGIAGDGGLYVPECLPSITQDNLKQLLGKDYRQIALAVSREFLDDFTEEELRRYFALGYAEDRFDTPEVAPTRVLDNRLAVLELWHGPTCAFKDLPLQILPYLMLSGRARMGDRSKIVIMVSTSGDTGSAALDGFAGVDETEVICFYPHRKVSEIQERQMVAQAASNTHVAAIQGNFDDAQTAVKQIFADLELNRKVNEAGYRLSAANSINWGRLVPQMVYFVVSYLRLVEQNLVRMGDCINLVVPSGNFGHILAAYYVRQMGLPIRKLICASNTNRVLADFIKTGEYNRQREFHTTMSPSMDILISSNLERLLFDACGKDASMVSKWMSDLKNDGIYHVDSDTHRRINEAYWGEYASEEDTRGSIRRTFADYRYLVDPHTAVGFAVLDKYRAETGDHDFTVIASTASPFKFTPSVLGALTDMQGISYNSDLELIPVLERFSGTPVPRGLATLASRPAVHNRVLTREQMPGYLLEMLGL